MKDNEDKFNRLDLEKKYADAGIIRFIEKNKGNAVATLDAELKRKLKNKARIVTLKGKKKISWD